MRRENPFWARVSRIFPSQRNGQTRAHNPKAQCSCSALNAEEPSHVARASCDVRRESGRRHHARARDIPGAPVQDALRTRFVENQCKVLSPGAHAKPQVRKGVGAFPQVSEVCQNRLLIHLSWVRVPPPEPREPLPGLDSRQGSSISWRPIESSQQDSESDAAQYESSDRHAPPALRWVSELDLVQRQLTEDHRKK